MGDVDRAEFWQGKYDEPGLPPWDGGGPTPPLTAVLGRADLIAPGREVVVPGCGRGHDAVRWAEAGHRVLGVDFAPAAIAAGQALARARGAEARCRFEALDLFDLHRRYPAGFDVWLEYTCFCAIHPSRRAEYARVAAAALRPGGLLVGLFYPDVEGADGPPFPVRAEHLEATFLGGAPVEGSDTADGAADRADAAAPAPFTLVEARVPEASFERRRGKERLWILRRR